MKLLNTTTQEIETLVYAPTGCDCLPDLICDDNQITHNEEHGCRQGSAEAIEFWREWINAAETADRLEAELAEKIGKDAAWQVSADAAGEVEFNDQPAARIRALEKAIAQ